MYYGIPGRARRLRAFYRPFVAPDSVCFDVGAHAGNRVRAWRALGARVVAVEPQRLFGALLERLYGDDPAVTLVRAALGARAGVAEILVSSRHPTVSTLSRDWAERVARSRGFAGVRWDRRERVPVTTLDALIAEHGNPAFVKIDVEGAEAEVLAGLSTPVPALSFEFLPAAPEGALACLERLSVLGDYRYNWSLGERLRLESAAWVEPAAVRAFLERLPPEGPSGDVYARQARARPAPPPAAGARPR